jgi:hypothetical protein
VLGQQEKTPKLDASAIAVTTLALALPRAESKVWNTDRDDVERKQETCDPSRYHGD